MTETAVVSTQGVQTSATTPRHVQSQSQTVTFRIFQWNQGDPSLQCRTVNSLEDLEQLLGSDLDIIILEQLDWQPSIPDLDNLLRTFHVPQAFTEERETGVTHAFGGCTADDGLEVLWMHLLGADPDQKSYEAPGKWLKSAYFWSWRPQPDGHKSWANVGNLTMIAFQPRAGLAARLIGYLDDPDAGRDFERILQDPFVLVDLALETWYQRIEQSAKEMTRRVRKVEEKSFEEARRVQERSKRSTPTSIVPDVDLTIQPHAILKNAIFLVESLDASMSLVDLALWHHKDSHLNRTTSAWKNVERALRRRKELFHAVKLRSASSHSRMLNVINLAFHLQARQEAKVALRDGRTMRILSVLGMVFLPISTVSSIFGTQFFTSVLPGEDGGDRQGGGAGPEFVVNSKFSIMWAVAIPLTSAIVIGWVIWDNWAEIRFRFSTWRHARRVTPHGPIQHPELGGIELADLGNRGGQR